MHAYASPSLSSLVSSATLPAPAVSTATTASETPATALSAPAALSDADLLEHTRTLATEERRLTAQVLRHLEEIERRGIHLKRHSSLFRFCLSELGYSENEANARISAMRLSRELPEVISAVESGKLSLTNLVKVQAYFRSEKKAGAPVSTTEKALLLKELSGKSARACERVLAERLPLAPAVDRERALAGARTEITFTANASLRASLERIRELWGHQGKMTYAELIERMAQLVLKRIDPEQQQRQQRRERPSKTKRSAGAGRVEVSESGEVEAEGQKEQAQSDLPSPPPELLVPESRHIPVHVRREVWRRDGGRCTHRFATVEDGNGERCSSRFALELDHVLPYAYGGTHTAENLRLLCRAHHRGRHDAGQAGNST
jgi:hypothetical protein